jgi:hypothetical protein
MNDSKKKMKKKAKQDNNGSEGFLGITDLDQSTLQHYKKV